MSDPWLHLHSFSRSYSLSAVSRLVGMLVVYVSSRAMNGE